MDSKPLTPLQQRVLQVVNSYPKTANDDPMLLDTYWHMYDDWLDNKSLYWNLSRSTSPESITRARRKLHELGYIKYSDEADAAREKQFKTYRNEYGEEIVII